MNLIPDKLQPYAKSVVAALGVILAAVLQAVSALPEDWQNAASGAVLLLTPVVTYWIPNIEKFIDNDPVDDEDSTEDSAVGSEPSEVDAGDPEASAEDDLTAVG